VCMLSLADLYTPIKPASRHLEKVNNMFKQTITAAFH